MRFVIQTITLTTGAVLAGIAMAGAAQTSSSVLYERDVRPIFKAHCFHCHGEAGEKKGGLDLRLQRLVLQGGESGPAIAAGKRDQSRLFKLISSGKMPPEDKSLSAEEVAVIGRWIDQGAITARPEPAATVAEVRAL